MDQLMVLRVVALLPDRFSWLQREIFRTENMTVEKLLQALKPHVRSLALSASQSHKEKAVGAGAESKVVSQLIKKEAKALAAIQKQNKEMAREIEKLKQAKPARPDESRRGKAPRAGALNDF